jgi:hypothetical protein
MVVKNIIIYIVLFVFVLWFIHSIRRTFKTIKEFLMPAKDINLNSLSDDKKDDFISNVIFAKMTREQKYAYIYTIESFLSFADNTPENIDKDMTDIVKKQGILATYNYTLKLLNLKEEDIDKAISFFDNDYLITPIECLKQINEYLVTDSLLYICYQITETKEGVVNGQEIKELCKDFLYDYFGDLGYSQEKIDETISKIQRN